MQYLKRYWSQMVARRNGVFVEPTERSWRFDNLLVNGLGLPIEEATQYLMQANPTFAEFENWVLDRNGGQLATMQVERLNSLFAGREYPEHLREHLRSLEQEPDVLSADDLAL